MEKQQDQGTVDRRKVRIQVACVASITTRNGKKIYAKHYGKKCFPIYKTVEVRA